MSLGEALYEACRLVRDGGTLDASSLAREVAERHQAMSARLQELPDGLVRLRELADIAFDDYSEAVTMLRVACDEETPELAQWAMERSLSGRDTMRRLRQLLEEYSQALCEEADDGDF
ncbi:MAG: hypothetical protein KF760_15615 [Candidatus Eremiobacteraeota bacterium]|nr:hypothetical protein [Candidatus Eremiobacteraeota bacterium]MCW5869294.1 hypothetical protein [Candidatus Eremiobacteraeota bacterium]